MAGADFYELSQVGVPISMVNSYSSLLGLSNVTARLSRLMLRNQMELATKVSHGAIQKRLTILMPVEVLGTTSPREC